MNYKYDKKFRKIKKILLINIWPTYDKIDLRPVSRTEVDRNSTTKCIWTEER
jgi:hypothetical protein